ncbi:DUF1501 domain-containing protein [Actinocrinis puniceicyclus]|uniref:DUF1501 domain-containing protein n=1 Tax=Actinocrinis puniceicyclus TaxID=977794 RepID=A0A8J7WRY5_9ACTN|nr:DUF1501 domain-containing protein [Actinocrinis puniceicyclus]MBS2965352.1 DUF1501 domain-containing protein [Actinocrinis puniceicyclus]
MDTLTRRRFLLASGVTGATALAGGAAALAWSDLHKAAAADPLPPGEGIVVLLTLYGGNDGLNTLVPATDGAYQKARPDLAYQPHEVLDVGDALGLNPAMTALHDLWRGGKVAIVRGVGYPRPNHSHFVSMDIWQTASPSEPGTSGWLGRWLDAQPDDRMRALRAVSLGGVLPPLLAGTKTAGSALPLGRFALPRGTTGSALKALGASSAQDCPNAAYAARDTADLFTVSAAFSPILADASTAAGGDGNASPGAAKPGTGPGGKNAKRAAGNALARQLDIVAACIESSVPTRVYAVSLGGFDTHSAEKGTQSALLKQVSDAIGAFQQRIGAGARGKDVVLVAYSEFGRRVAANANDGTDHGTAGPVFVVGESVRGGFVGEQPSLTDLDNGDLKFHTDFRSVYATVLDRVLGTDPASVLGGPFPALSFL